MLHDKLLCNKVPFQSTKYRKKELCVDNIKTIGDVYCPKNGQFCCLVLTVRIVYTSRDYEKPSPFLNKFLRQSQPSTSEPEPKKVKMCPNMK